MLPLPSFRSSFALYCGPFISIFILRLILSGITKEPSGVTPVNPVRKFRFRVTISSPIVPERVRLSVRFSRIPPPFSEKAPGKSTVKREICISFRFPSVPARITNGRNGYASLNVWGSPPAKSITSSLPICALKLADKRPVVGIFTSSQ